MPASLCWITIMFSKFMRISICMRFSIFPHITNLTVFQESNRFYNALVNGLLLR